MTRYVVDKRDRVAQKLAPDHNLAESGPRSAVNATTLETMHQLRRSPSGYRCRRCGRTWRTLTGYLASAPCEGGKL